MNKIDLKQLRPLYDGTEHRDFREMLNYCAMQYIDTDAFIIKHKGAGRKDPAVYEHITYPELLDHVNYLGTAMLNRGYLGKRIAIIGNNSYEWYLSYLTTLCGIGISVPLDKGLPSEEAISSLKHIDAEILIFDKAHADLADRLKQEETLITEYICMTQLDGFPDIAELLEEGRAAFESGDKRYPNLPIDPDDVTILLFTSGTSSLAKTVMLTQHNILYNVYVMQRTEPIEHGDVNMAFLPYHHTFGSTGQALMLACGVTSVFCDGLKYIQKNMAEYRVTKFVCVPLLIEAMYKRIMQQIEKQGKMASFRRGVRIAKLLRKFHIDVRRKLFKDILEPLGGKLTYIISGASPLDPGVIKGFNDIGITIVQGYGLTETSPVVLGENAATLRPGSIGFAMYGIEAAIADPDENGIGEIITRSPSVMKGYYKDPEANAKAIRDGWFYTGDLARVDKDGFVFITGRAKNVIVLKNGKNVYPEELEILITDLPYVKENIVIGEPRRKNGDNKDLALCARIVYDPEYMKEHYGTEDLQEIEKIIRADLNAINDTLPAYKQILRLNATDREMVKTTTGKIKRYEEAAAGTGSSE